ncbi:MAG TPA: ATP-binding protein [Bacteroidia bacterium]|jgi:signal transduction histidine kinase|nr:ATP-binding protein [Bacteroidia bacterium]
MIKPNIPPNEAQRLKELERYQLIGTAEDEDFDFITSMAAQITNSKISLVSFVLEDMQWFLSHHGLMAREASREYSFCGHAINKPEEILIVEDARKDERFWDNPNTTKDPYVIFYAGVPLVTPNGLPLGTLCVVDDRPKSLSTNQIDQLKKLAKQTLNLLQLRRNQLELNKTNEELKKNIELVKIANNELKTFSYTVAHDLRAPLRAMNGYAEMLIRDYGEKLDQEAKRLINNITQNASRMGRLIDDLLSFSRLGRKELNVTKVCMDDLTKEVFVELNKTIDNKVDIRISELPDVMGDHNLLYQVMMNLISNAIKYSSKKENPIIELFSEFKNGETIFVIKDNGSGFDMKYSGKLFNVFQRLHADDEFDGNGIGLATVSRIIAKHGGRIWAEGQVNVGATFYFTLPINKK